MNMRVSMPESEPGGRDTWIENHSRNPPLFWPWPEQDQFLQSVQRLADNAENVMLLLGPTGIGKTTFAYRIQAQIPDHWLFLRVDANPQLHIYQLLQIFIQKIGLTSAMPWDLDTLDTTTVSEVKNVDDTDETSTESKSLIFFDETYLADVLHSHFSKLRLQGRLPVVLIDDADQMPFNTLWYLLQLHQRNIEGLNAFSLILLARPTIETLINQTQNCSAYPLKIQYLNMPRLTSEQTASYILHFFAAAKTRRIPRWTQEQFTIIYHQAQGLPGQINELVKFTLRDDTKPKKFLWLRRSLLLLAGMSATAVLSFNLLNFTQFTTISELFTTWFDNKYHKIEQNTWISKPLPLPIPTPPPTIPINSASSIPLNLPAAIETKPEKPQNINTTNELVATPSVEPTPETNKPAPQSPILSELNPTTVIDTLQPAATESHSMQRNDWLLQQPITNYTLQLNHAASKEEAERYIARNHLTDQSFYVEILQQDQPVYYVLHGVYSTRVAANAAITKLPPNLRKKKPFPVNFKKLQSAIQPHH